MRAQVGPVCECACAVLAPEGLLSRVSADVTLKQPRSRERFSAQRAFTGQRVGADVHLEGAQGDVSLVAVLTAELLLNV